MLDESLDSEVEDEATKKNSDNDDDAHEGKKMRMMKKNDFVKLCDKHLHTIWMQRCRDRGVSPRGNKAQLAERWLNTQGVGVPGKETGMDPAVLFLLTPPTCSDEEPDDEPGDGPGPMFTTWTPKVSELPRVLLGSEK